jgi:hypothetical protein
MRVSLVTKTGKNFGAVLQAVALSYAIRELGAEVQIVQYPSKRLAESFRTIKRIHDIPICECYPNTIR